MPKSLRILTLPVGLDGCSWYRVRQPMAMLKAHTPHDTHISNDDKDDPIMWLQALANADLVVARQGVQLADTKKFLTQSLIHYNKEFKQNLKIKAKWVLDIDDNPELTSPYAPNYLNSGTAEYYDHNLCRWLWKDGVNGFDLKANLKRLAAQIESLRGADLVTVTTDRLYEYANQYSDRVAILPNAINFKAWWPRDHAPNHQLRVGWSGGISHYEDWYHIKEPLNKLLREYRFKLVIMGTIFEGIIDKDLRDLVEYHPWVSADAHSYRTMCMDLDLAIIPLADLPFNHYKSCIKWYEFSALKIPCVVANVEPYSAEIKNRVNALGYNSPHEFKKAVFALLHDDLLRKKLANNAYNWVFKHRNAATVAEQYAEAYVNLTSS